MHATAIPRGTGRVLTKVLLAALLGTVGLTGCADFFNPSFLNLFDAGNDGQAAFAAVDGPSGHIPILFKNSARMSDTVFRYVIQANTVVRPEVVDELLIYNPQLTRDEIEDILQNIIDDQPVDLESVNIPPRVRVTIGVVNENGGVHVLEFLDGLRLARTETSDAQLPLDLTENSNNTFIPQCDIIFLTFVRVDVFVPVDLRLTRNLFDRDGFIVGEECFAFIQPQFDDLQPDEGFDPSQGEFTLLRNYDPRFVPTDLESVPCGAVVIGELTGTLFVPFRDVPSECDPPNPPADGRVPAYLNTDTISAAQIPGRYGLSLSIRTSE